MIILSFNRFFVSGCFALLFLLLLDCEKLFSPDEKGVNAKSDAKKNYIHLQNQTDHSGVLIKLIEADAIAVTDSSGFFILPKVVNGEYTFQARYPFFEIVEQKVKIADSMLVTKIQLELEQQIQFWVEPAETTLSVADKTRFWEFMGYVKNISQNIYEAGPRSGLSEWGIVPETINWNFGGNNNINSKRCFQDFTYIGPTDIPEKVKIYLQPGETKSSRYIDVWQLGYECTPPGRTYLLFFILVDQVHFDEFFQGRFFVDANTDNSQSINPLWKSLFKKRELFRPAIIHFTH
jgi:hypothetical protein